jgi:hypothetical protein
MLKRTTFNFYWKEKKKKIYRNPGASTNWEQNLNPMEA